MAPAGPEDTDLRSGDLVGDYRLEEFLGQGAVAVVFRAVRETDGAVVALKVLKERLSADPVYQRRFVHEARAASEVQHKHLVPILEAGQAGDRHFLAVAFVAGRSLGDRIDAEGPLPLADVLRIAAEAGSGLDALHAHGLVHRDIKPSNIMLAEDGSASLTDFGLAKGPAYTVLTSPGQVMGTLDYLAPELVKGEQGSPASDMYALGCVVYEGLAGKPPFADRGMFQVAMAHLNEQPPDPCVARPELPGELSWALLQALAKDPAKRPPTAIAFAHMLRLAARAPSNSRAPQAPTREPGATQSGQFDS
jgi:serine/threonine protein kinase